MSRIANSLMSQNIIQRIIASPRTVVAILAAILTVLVAILFTKELFVVFCGLAGMVAGYLIHNFQGEENPVHALRSVFGLRRIWAVTLGSIMSALIAAILFWESLFTTSDVAALGVVFTAGAYAFFAFSVSCYVFGRRAISRAKRILKRADAEQTHAWFMRSEALRKASVF